MDKQKGQKEYVKLRLKLARDKMRVAKILFDNGEYRDTVSGAYYATFYAAKALLLSQGQDPTTHRGVDTLFHQFCRAQAKLSSDFANIFSKMREARLNADYREKASFTKKDAREAIDMARSFLKEIRRLIK